MAAHIKRDPPTGLKYRFHLVCPRCGKTSEHTTDRLVPHVNCGDCLIEAVEIVEMIVEGEGGL